MLYVYFLNLRSQSNQVYFWVLLFFLVRMVGITNPPLETGHNWRQVTGLMVARNFLEQDPTISLPRVDDNNGGSGIIGMEFPMINYSHYLISKVFGYTHWYGRLIVLLISSFGMLYFYRLLRLLDLEHRSALFAMILLGSSIWFSFSRKMMPDTASVSLVFIGLFYGVRYLKEMKAWLLLPYIFFVASGVLVKIPATMYLVLIPAAWYLIKSTTRAKIVISLVSTIPVIALWLWYFQWNPYLSQTYGNWYNAGMTLSAGFNELKTHLSAVFAKFYFNSFYSYVAFSVFISGFFLMFYRTERKLILLFSSLLLLFIPYMLKSGFYFHHHNYYIIPFVPAMAIIIGWFLSQIRIGWLASLLIFLCIAEGIVNQQHDFFIKGSEGYKLTIETIADRCSKRSDLFTVLSDGNPQLIYLAHRKGWLCSEEQLRTTDYLEANKQLGCRYILVDHRAYPNVRPALGRSCFTDHNFRIYSLY